MDKGGGSGLGGGSNIGKDTLNSNSDGKTWDGFGKFNNIPMNPDANVAKKPQLSREEMLREKFKYLKKLEDIEKKGATLSKEYSWSHPLKK